MISPRLVLVAIAGAALVGAGIAGCDDDGGDGDADADSDVDEDAGGDGDVDGDADGDGDADTDTDADADEDVDFDTTPEEACVAPCAMLAPCVDAYADEAACEAACVTAFENLEPIGTACLAAYAELLGCWSAFDCDALLAFYERASGSFECAGEEAALAAACMPDVAGPIRDSCRAGCAKSSACFASARNVAVAGCFRACGLQLSGAAVDGEECVDALLAARSCGHALSCGDYSHWLGQDGDPYPCQTEDEAAAAACPSL